MNDDFIERTQRQSENWTGEAVTPEKMVDTFPLYGREKRAAHLDNFDAELDQAASSGNLRSVARMFALRRDLRDTHKRLMKSGK